VHVHFAEHLLAVVTAKREMELSGAEHVIDDAEVVEDFETSGLQAFSF
jgi:hypothetical protein